MSLTLVSATNNVPGFNASYETITDEMCKWANDIDDKDNDNDIINFYNITCTVKFLVIFRVLPSLQF